MTSTHNTSTFRNVHAVKILVGAWKTEFWAHADRLITASRFFKAALTGKFKEAQRQEVELPEEDAETFDVFIKWLYQGDLILPSPKIRIEDTEAKLETLAKLYVLGDKLDIRRLKNGTMSLIASGNSQQTSPTRIGVIWPAQLCHICRTSRP